jgi:hypothetical protein
MRVDQRRTAPRDRLAAGRRSTIPARYMAEPTGACPFRGPGLVDRRRDQLDLMRLGTGLDAKGPLSTSGKGGKAGEGAFQHHAAGRFCTIQRRLDRLQNVEDYRSSPSRVPLRQTFCLAEGTGYRAGIFGKYLEKHACIARPTFSFASRPR